MILYLLFRKKYKTDSFPKGKKKKQTKEKRTA